jgi:phosphoglycerate dehydrogenase-like enzyme/protein tyrosine phosphatase (PTP) superfamily phosphohydrolase (DUF442 family)
MTMDDTLTPIFNFRRLSDRVVTSGLPTADQLRAISDAGFEVVISLLPDNDEETLPGERALVEELGLVFEQIPVIWTRPIHDDLVVFFRVMARHAGRPIYVHCAANFRVSSFMALYRILRLGWPVEAAMEDVHAIWQPYDYWQAFIDAELAADQMLRVHFAEELDPERRAYLASILEPRVAVTVGDISVPARFHILVDGDPTREKLAASPDLRAVLQPYTGVSPENLALMREFPGVALHNSHSPALPTAEMAFALLLTAAKAIVPLDRTLRQGDWSRRVRPIPSVLLSGKTALLLGYGAIGRHVARMCRGMGMQVLALRRNGDTTSDEFADVFPASSLHSLLPRADALIVSLPLTDETRGVIGARELALLPRGAVLVNVGRGPVVDEGALYQALKDETLGAAGLDVWYNYPPDDDSTDITPPSAHPFGELDNVVLSPHRGGLAYEADQRRARMAALAEIVNALARGEPAPNRVDLERGY